MTPLGIAFGLAGWMAVGAVSVYAPAPHRPQPPAPQEA
jgi:hypothetical protein